MALITFGNDSASASAPSTEAQRGALVADLRSAFDLLDRLGVRRQLCGSKKAQAGLLFSAAGLRLVGQALGVETTLRILALVTSLAEKHKGYLTALSAPGSKGERMRLRGQLLLTFSNVKPLGPVSAEAAKTAPAVAAQASVMGAWAPLIVAAGAGAFGMLVALRALAQRKTAPERALLDYFRARKTYMTSANEDRAASALAASMNLPRTAIVILEGRGLAGLPANEFWPGTTVPVATFVATWLDRSAPVISGIGNMGRGRGEDEDLSGVERPGRVRRGRHGRILRGPSPSVSPGTKVAALRARPRGVSPPGAPETRLAKAAMRPMSAVTMKVGTQVRTVSQPLAMILRSLDNWKIGQGKHL
jgi:hypothetical protein